MGQIEGPQASVSAMSMWDPDGNGPQPLQLVVAGNFTSAGGVPVNNVALYNPTTGTWSNLGSGLIGAVYAINIGLQGELYIGGGSLTGGTNPAFGVARWSGNAWERLTADTPMLTVYAMTTLENGDIIAGGLGYFIGGTYVSRIARWNGTAWSSLQGGLSEQVRTLLTLPNNGFIAGCAGPQYFGPPTYALSYFVRWNSGWTLVRGMPEQYLLTYAGTDLTKMPDGSVVAGMAYVYDLESHQVSVRRLDDSGSSSILETYGDYIKLHATSHGELIANIGTRPGSRVIRWDGSSWSSLGIVMPDTGYALDFEQLPNGDIVMAGRFASVAGVPALNIARFGLPPGCCDDIDFNNNEVFREDSDVIDFFDVLAGGNCPTCNDIDFNNNAVFPEDQDVIDFFTVLAGGTC